MAERKCSSLKKNEIVVFNLFNLIYGEKKPMDGNVIFIDKDRESVCVAYLEGYRSETADISFEDMLGVYNPHGEYMKFGNICGKSDVLIPE